MTLELKIAVWIIVTATLALLTRRSLTGFCAHGVYRLAAGAASVALVLLNLEGWFVEPFATHQVFSWCAFLGR